MSNPLAPSAPGRGRQPDFIIGGAMKAGTTTLHRLLVRHPGVFIPEREIHYFSMDDITEHPDFAAPAGGSWVVPEFEANLPTSLPWYHSMFDPARTGQLIGEHSTVYLPSSKAPERIARMLPEVRLIFLLRDPVARTYSHYWHRVRSGQAVHRFEPTLRYAPHTLITRSFYRRQLEAYFGHVPRERIQVLIFEEFIREPQRLLDSVCAFLGLTKVDVAGTDTHYHRGDAPRLAGLQLLQNRLFRPLLTRVHRPDLPGVAPAVPGRAARLALRLDRSLRFMNRGRSSYPKMRSGTREFLGALFARENAGLSDLLGVDLGRWWPCMRGHGRAGGG